MSSDGTSNLTGGVPCTVTAAAATAAATTTATTASTAGTSNTTTGAIAATSDFTWFQHLLNMGPSSATQVPPAPGVPSVDGTSVNPLLLQVIQMQQSMQQQMFMMQQQWMAHGSSINSAVSI